MAPNGGFGGAVLFAFVMTAAACAPSGAAPAAADRAAAHVVLLGDSIFDNGRYVPGEPCVHDQLVRALADAGDKATLLAVDGDVTADVAGQLDGLPVDATHLVVSVGGNDALRHASILDRPVEDAAELFAELAAIHARFRDGYARMLDAVLAHGKPTAVCTIYDSNFEAPKKELADVALSVFNDAILRCAGERGVPVIDLRRIFRTPADYANPIEPSAPGGAKMVAAIVAAVRGHDFAARRTVLYP